MFACFVCALLGFRARKFPAKSEKKLDIYRLPTVVCQGQRQPLDGDNTGGRKWVWHPTARKPQRKHYRIYQVDLEAGMQKLHRRREKMTRGLKRLFTMLSVQCNGMLRAKLQILSEFKTHLEFTRNTLTRSPVSGWTKGLLWWVNITPNSIG